MEPKISIITVVFNGAKTLERTILSVVNQNYSNLEYIVIDGGSTDGTIEIIKRYNKYISQWVSEKDEGISDAFNKGIKLATGDWVGLINSDDWYENQVFSLLAHVKPDIDIVYGNLQYWRNFHKDYNFKANHLNLLKEMTLNHPASFVKRHVYLNYGMFDIKYKYAMDYDLMLRFFLAKLSFEHQDKTFAHFSLDGVSDKYWLNAYIEVRNIKLKNGLSSALAHSYYFFQVFRTGISRTLQRIGFSRLVSWYRINLSLMKKSKN
jgi:glycosyltransferase involved in cell wall biosynthesis